MGISCEPAPTTWIEIDAAAWRHNYRNLQQLFAPTQVLVVLKSDAYGLGLAVMLPLVAELEVAGIALNDVREALRARELGYGGPIVVIGPVLADHLAAVPPAADVAVVVASYGVLAAWLALPDELAPPIHLKVDTGMVRQGFYPEDVMGVVERLVQRGRLSKVVGVMSHTSNTVLDGSCQSSVRAQCRRFAELKTQLAPKFAAAGAGSLPQYHLSASHAALVDPDSHFDVMRLGIILFGQLPYPVTAAAISPAYQTGLRALQPVVRWYAVVIQVKAIKQGDRVGYEGSYISDDDATIAVVGVGYAHGYQLAARGGGYMLAQGFMYPVIGKVSMTMSTILIPPGAPMLCEGERMTLIGECEECGDRDVNVRRRPGISLDEYSRASGRSPYAALTALHPAMPRRLVERA